MRPIASTVLDVGSLFKFYMLCCNSPPTQNCCLPLKLNNSLLQIVLVSCVLSLLTFQQTQAQSSKQRFDQILAKFGFKGLSLSDKTEDVSDETDDSLNEIPDNFITHTRVNNGVFVIKIRRKHPIIKRRKVRILSGDKHDLMFLNHLNERIQNPKFKSKYPQRKLRRIK